MSAASAVLDPPRDEVIENHDAEPESHDPVDESQPEIVIEAGGQISMVAGGCTPDQSTIVFRGGEVSVNGEFEKGTRLKFEIEGVVSEVTFTDLMDQKTGVVTGTKRKHVLKIAGIQKVDE
jgi:hypothetical protein